MEPILTIGDGLVVGKAWAEAILEERNRLRDAIIEHRSQKADDRCIDDDDRLYEAVGDGIKCDRRVGSKAEMLKNCERFIERRCQQGKWPTYAELEKALSDLITVTQEFNVLPGWNSNDQATLERARTLLSR